MNWEEYKYWFMRTYGEQRYGNSGCGGPILIACVLIAFLLFGCKTTKCAESTETQDSVRIEYKEKLVPYPVEVRVEVPVEAKERETKDSTSFLETSFAKSTASMKWKDGMPYLFHSLENKAQSIVKKDTVQVVEKEKIIRRTIRNTVTKTVYREWQPKWWQSTLMWIGGIVSICLVLFIIYNIVKLYRRWS